MNAVSINNYELGIKEYNSQRVVTFKDIDLVHERNLGTARRNFNSNKKHFIENEDYYMLKPNVRNSYIEKIPPKGVTLITESGYMMLVKSFTDDLAWEVQRKLVKSYFRAKQEVQQAMPLPAPTVTVPMSIETVTPKTYKGDLVLTVNDLAIIMGISKVNINYNLRHSYIFVKDVDFKFLKDADLVKFKNENRGQFFNANTLNVIYPSGAEKMMRYAPYNSPALLDRITQYYKATPKLLEAPPTIHSPNLGGNTERLMDLIDFLKKRLIEAENANDKRIEEIGPNKADRLKVLMQIIDLQKHEIKKNEKYQILSAGAAFGALQFSQAIGDISVEREDQLRNEIHEAVRNAVKSGKK